MSPSSVKPSQLFPSLAFTCSEIRSRSPEAASFARSTVIATGALRSFRDVFRSTAESAEQKGVDAGRGAGDGTRAGDGHRAESSGGGGDFKSAPHTARWMPLRDSLWDSSSLSDRGAGPGLNVGNRVQQMGEGAGHGAGGGGRHRGAYNIQRRGARDLPDARHGRSVNVPVTCTRHRFSGVHASVRACMHTRQLSI